MLVYCGMGKGEWLTCVARIGLAVILVPILNGTGLAILINALYSKQVSNNRNTSFRMQSYLQPESDATLADEMHYLGDYVIPSSVLNVRQGGPAFGRVCASRLSGLV